MISFVSLEVSPGDGREARVDERRIKMGFKSCLGAPALMAHEERILAQMPRSPPEPYPQSGGQAACASGLGFTHFLLLMDGITGVDEHLVTLWRRRTSSPREVRFRLPAPVSSQHLNTDGPAGWRGAAGGRVLATVGTRTPWGPAPRPGRCPQETYRSCSAPAALSSASGTGSGWVMRWMKLETIIQSEVSQKEKHQYSILTHIYGI